MDTKKWYASKTIWVNVAVLAALGVQAMIGRAALDPELQAGLLAVSNTVLRLFTSKPLA